MTISKVKELPELTISTPARDARVLKGQEPTQLALSLPTLLLTWALGQEQGPFCLAAGCSFTLKMGPNLMQQQPRGERERAHISSDPTFCPSGPLVSARKGLRIPSDQEGGKGSTKHCSAPTRSRQ